MKPQINHPPYLKGIISPRFWAILMPLIAVACLALMASRAPEMKEAHSAPPRPSVEVRAEPYPAYDSVELASDEWPAPLKLRPDPSDATDISSSAEMHQLGSEQVIEVSRLKLIAATLVYLLGLGLAAKVRQTRLKQRKVRHKKLRSNSFKVVLHRILIGLMIAGALGGSTLLSLVIYNIALSFFPLALLAIICTLAVVAALAVILYLAKESSFATSGHSPRIDFQNDCAMIAFIICVIIPVSIVSVGIVFGLFMPLFCGVAFQFWAAILSWLCIAGLGLLTYAGIDAILMTEY